MRAVDVVLATLTPLLIVLGLVFGVAISWFLISVGHSPTLREQQLRDQAIAKASAQKAVDETIQRLFREG